MKKFYVHFRGCYEIEAKDETDAINKMADVSNEDLAKCVSGYDEVEEV